MISLYKPYEFDWREFLRIELADDARLHADTASESNTSTSDGTATPEKTDPENINTQNEKTPKTSSSPLSTQQISLDDVQHPFDDATLRELDRWLRIAVVTFVVLVLVTFVAWPMPLYRDYIFTKSFFSGWVTVAIIWQFGAFGAVVIYPLWDGRRDIAIGARGAWKSSRQYFTRK